MNDQKTEATTDGRPTALAVAPCSAPIWNCIGHEPTEWALGIQVGNEMTKIRAAVRRLDDGRWAWEAHPWGYVHRGIQPSRETAMQAAEDSLPNIAGQTAAPKPSQS